MLYRIKKVCAGLVVLLAICAIGCFGASAVHAQAADADQSAAEFARVDRLETQISTLYAQVREMDAGVTAANADAKNQALRSMVTLYTEIIDQSPQKTSAALVDNYLGRGFAYVQLGEYEQALNDDNMALTVEPDYPYALSNRGFVYVELGRSDAALSDFERFLKITAGDPNMTPTLTEMVQNKVKALRQQLGQDSTNPSATNPHQIFLPLVSQMTSVEAADNVTASASNGALAVVNGTWYGNAAAYNKTLLSNNSTQANIKGFACEAFNPGYKIENAVWFNLPKSASNIQKYYLVTTQYGGTWFKIVNDGYFTFGLPKQWTPYSGNNYYVQIQNREVCPGTYVAVPSLYKSTASFNT